MKDGLKFLPGLIPLIVSGRKTATRRPVNFPALQGKIDFHYKVNGRLIWSKLLGSWAISPNDGVYYPVECPYGHFGDKTEIAGTGIHVRFTAVKVQKVQEIKEEDLVKEGFDTIEDFISFWEVLYPGSWKRNDWVWVIEFAKEEIAG